MKKELKTLMVAVDEQNLNEQEKQYFSRMIDTLRAVDVAVLILSERGVRQSLNCFLGRLADDQADYALGLTDNEVILRMMKSAGLPTVYYSYECRGGYGADMLLMSFGEIGLEFYQQIFDRFHGQPWTILETKRCVLREAVASDLDDFYEIYAQPSVSRYMPSLSENYEEEQEKLAAYIKNQYGFYGFGTWTIVDSQTGQIVGRAGLEMSKDSDGIELGYLIREEYQRQGIATEVCQAILKYAKRELDLEEVELFVEVKNESSVRLAKRLGFVEKHQEKAGFRQFIVSLAVLHF